MIKDLKKQSIKQNEKTIPQNKNKTKQNKKQNRMEDPPTPHPTHPKVCYLLPPPPQHTQRKRRARKNF